MNRTDKLLNWIKQRHEGQLIRRTTEPYVNHLVAVAELASVIPLGYETGLCHDLFEETETTKMELYSALTTFGYTDPEAHFILNCTIELTDVFTKKNYPDLKKKARKAKEAARLTTISSAAQTVKYGDMIYNIGWVLKYDLKHAGKYLRKKQLFLTSMTNGDQDLHQRALKIVDDALRFLKNEQNNVRYKLRGL
ncbi:hypothetical protein ACFFGT_04685 [Mucilaginibacter angelicae]|uniref:Metal-dependent phosphohydrolase n=1 Tax=Mucilaginibacter angelicae TaxID=869718 RepID=A0ABV6L170_9SPHI